MSGLEEPEVSCYVCGSAAARVMLLKKVAGSAEPMNICDKCVEILFHSYMFALKTSIAGLAGLHAPAESESIEW